MLFCHREYTAVFQLLFLSRAFVTFFFIFDKKNSTNQQRIRLSENGRYFKNANLLSKRKSAFAKITVAWEFRQMRWARVWFSMLITKVNSLLSPNELRFEKEEILIKDTIWHVQQPVKTCPFRICFGNPKLIFEKTMFSFRKLFLFSDIGC